MDDVTIMDQIAKGLINSGPTALCLLYFMLRDWKFMQKLSDAFASLKATLESLEKVNTRLTDIAGQVENFERSKKDDN